MSGFSPQGVGVQSGNYPGSQFTGGDGSPGVNTYHVVGTNSADGCPNPDWSFPNLDDLNALQQALNCILTNNGADPLPNVCAADNPCILLNKLKELFEPEDEIPPCPADASPTKPYVLTCMGGAFSWQEPTGGGGNTGAGCPDGFNIGTVYQFATSGYAGSWNVGDIFVGGTTQATPVGSTGTWTAIDSGSPAGTEGDGPYPTLEKTSC